MAVFVNESSGSNNPISLLHTINRDKRYRYSKTCLLVLVSIFFSLSAFAQKVALPKDSLTVDTGKKDFVSRMRKIGNDEAKNSVALFNREKEEMKQEELVEQIKKITQKAKVYIKTGIDSAEIDNELEDVKRWSKFVGDGIFVNMGTSQTHRNLSTTSKILIELLHRTNRRKREIDTYEKDLVTYRFKLDSLYADSSVYDFPKDSVQIAKYLKKLIIVVKEIGPVDTALKYAINNVSKLQDKANLRVINLSTQLAEIEGYQNELSYKTFNREFANLWGDVGYVRPFDDILHFSAVKAQLNCLFYTENYLGRIFIIFVLIGGAIIFLRSLKSILSQQGSPVVDVSKGHLVLRYTALSALVIILSLGQFIFPDPPFIFNCILWIVPAICLSFIFRGFISKQWMMIWLTFLVLFVLACADNLILQASRVERWGMVVLASVGGIFGIWVLIKGRKEELREKLILYFIALLVILEFTSVFANLFGRYNFSKTLLIAGYLNVIIGILFLWTVRLINEGLYMASGVYTKQDKKLFYINFDKVGEKVPALFYFFLIIGWFVLFGRNFYIFRFISDPLKDFFFDDRTIGNYSFTINNILIFFLIISLSVIASKVVSYFASEKGIDTPGNKTVNDGQSRKAGVGSWLLLIRVAIISTGLFLALAASGFPLEKITIIIGALGVGIGLGLQTLVNNLVSGLIIAFEKPVNVGDIVEISGQGGTVKSIGFRSSIISKWDGPDVVIPNGDLLNAHLINWTLAGSKRQMEIVIGVAYNTDLEKAKKIIMDIVAANTRIHAHPQAGVLFQDFNPGSIAIKVQFWVRDYKDGSAVRSEIIAAMDTAFKENDIVVPFPQQDVYIHELPDEKTPGPQPKPVATKKKRTDKKE